MRRVALLSIVDPQLNLSTDNTNTTTIEVILSNLLGFASPQLGAVVLSKSSHHSTS